jgi:hypothetical protein
MVVVEFDVDNDPNTGGGLSMLGIFPSCENCTSGCTANRIKIQPGIDIAVFIMLRGQGDDAATAFCDECLGPDGQCSKRGDPCGGCDQDPNCWTTGASCIAGDPDCYVIGQPQGERCTAGGGDCTLGAENCFDLTVPCEECTTACGEGRKQGEWYITAVSVGGAGGSSEPDRGRIEMPLPRTADSDSADCYTLPFKRIVEEAKAAGADFNISAAENVANVKWQVSAWYDPDFVTTQNDFFGDCEPGGTCGIGNPCAEVSDVIPDNGAGLADASGGDANTYCETNPDGDEDVDGNDLTKFLEDFGRGSYDRPCPNCRN